MRHFDGGGAASPGGAPSAATAGSSAIVAPADGSSPAGVASWPRSVVTLAQYCDPDRALGIGTARPGGSPTCPAPTGTVPDGTHRCCGGEGSVDVIKLAIFFVVVFFLATFPATWLLMLFLGNTGVHVGYWGVLPLGILVSALLGGVSASKDF
jgi:hypothetical protein